MKWVKDNIVSLILAAVCIIMGLLIFSIIRKKETDPPSLTAISEAYQKAYLVQDELIRVYRENNAGLTGIIEDHKRTDSILLVRLIANQPKYAVNDKKLKAVADAVHDLDREQLRRAYANY
ncbi:MAG: hypothetical protein ACT4OJ_10955 [Bacteroidota bacterium]